LLGVIVQSIFSYLLAICLLITVHELGHFIAARICKVRVLRFSVGFGKPIIHWYDLYGTEFVISSIPIGGYVILLGDNEGEVAESDKALSIKEKPVLSKMAIIAAGPLANILFAWLLYWIIFVVGVAVRPPIVGGVVRESLASRANIQPMQQIKSIDGKSIISWDDVIFELIANSHEPRLGLTTQSESGLQKRHLLNLTEVNLLENNQTPLTEIGIVPMDYAPPVIADVMSNMPASEKLQVNDKIVALDGSPISNRTQVHNFLVNKAQKKVVIQVEREGELLDFSLTPSKKLISTGEEVGFLGISYANRPWPDDKLIKVRQGPIKAIGSAFNKVLDISSLTVDFIIKAVQGKAAANSVSGPILIAKYAGESIKSGFTNFLSFLAIISISIAVINALPLPILDGGRFLYCCYELIFGRPIPDDINKIGVTLSVMVIATLLVFSLYNDILNL